MPRPPTAKVFLQAGGSGECRAINVSAPQSLQPHGGIAEIFRHQLAGWDDRTRGEFISDTGRGGRTHGAIKMRIVLYKPSAFHIPADISLASCLQHFNHFHKTMAG